MGTFAVIYTYGTDTDTERDAIRPQHKDFLADLHATGRLRISGPIDSGAGALLVLEGESAAEITSALDEDPFRKHDLIADRSVREWTIVFGGLR
ncbi:YciI family protein [Saccharopolyspora sp. NPDC049426]|uniref:YciI family protein n=1 Tax=Saccharopolyspora sp. NPDC049426 TaxID=3155652 RepID=UPI003423C435